MNDGKHKNTGLNFGGFSGYYGVMSAHDGYGGFDYLGDVEYMNASTWTQPGGAGYQLGWCDSGYQNVASATKNASLGWIDQYGLMESASAHSFSLDSLVATASWSANQTWEIISYTEKQGSLVEKASMYVSLSYDKADTIKFAGKMAKGFSNIAAVAFEMVSYGSPGNSCTYGTASYGTQMAIDNMKVKFHKNTDLKHNAGKLPAPYLLHHHSGPAHVQALPHPGSHAGEAGSAVQHENDRGHLAPAPVEHDIGLTSQFHLPAVEHL
jgi:hypothetical protein